MTTQSILTTTPENTSFLQATKFTFAFPTLPFLKYFCQSVGLPGVSTQEVPVPAPFATMYRHGDTLNFDKFTATVLVDEDLRVWEESYNWIVSLTKPADFRQYVRNTSKGEKPYHDGVLTLNTNANVPNIRFKFTYCHPVSISAIQLSAADNANTQITADIVFRYDQIEIERLKKDA